MGRGVRSWAKRPRRGRGCGGDVVVAVVLTLLARERSGWWCLDIGDGDQFKLIRQMSYISTLDAGLLIKISAPF